MHTCYSPVRRSPAKRASSLTAAPRLACVKPAASVHPEPGSNSPLLLYLFRFFFVLFVFSNRPSDIYFISERRSPAFIGSAPEVFDGNYHFPCLCLLSFAAYLSCSISFNVLFLSLNPLGFVTPEWLSECKVTASFPQIQIFSPFLSQKNLLRLVIAQ